MSHTFTMKEPRFRQSRAISTAGGGTALSTTTKYLGFPKNTEYVTLTARNFSGANAVQYHFNEYLYIIKTSDLLVVKDNLDNESRELQDGDSTDYAIDSWDVAANGHYLYVGAARQFRGVYVNIGSNANAQNSVLTVNYWNGAWTGVSGYTDGTISTSKTMAVDGTVVWSAPANWMRTTLLKIGDTTLKGADLSWTSEELYWTRWEVGTQLDNDCDIAEILCLNEVSANYEELANGQARDYYIKTHESGGFGSLEMLTAAGTASLICNVSTTKVKGFE